MYVKRCMYLETAFIDQLTASFTWKQINVDYHIGDLSPPVSRIGCNDPVF